MEPDLPVPILPARRRAETDDQRGRRLHRLAVQLADREHRAAAAIAASTGALPRSRAHVLPLAKIEDEARRLEVWQARVERLEALLDQTQSKRETRAKIVLGATLLAEARATPGDPLLARLVEILDRRLDRPRDRQAIAEMLDLPLRSLPQRQDPKLPDFDVLAAEVLAAGKPARARRLKE
jgi:hypothetical protein